MKAKEYTIDEMRALLSRMSETYDLARVVDPIECRILKFNEDGRISLEDRCYSIWNASQKCINCSSASACRTGCHHEKAERFQDKVYHIESDPVTLKLPDGGDFSAVIERVVIEKDNPAPMTVNDREAENVGMKAAQHEALHDNLTSVLNAGAFYELARELILRIPDYSWVMITGNIMDFRLVNALFGVLKGNEVLIRTAGMMRQIAEHSSGLCGRLGGDQFALLLPQAQYREESLLEIARTLQAAFNSGIYTCRIHFGVYRVDDEAIPISVMCGRANSAQRTIREDLKKTVAYFDDGLHLKRLHELEIINGFEAALRDGQFRLYLQPMVDESRRVFCAEALVRWQKPDGTFVMPGDFIPTLENAGLIHELDMYIWEQAARQLSHWKGTEKGDIAISINMSAKDFFSIDVFDVLTGLVNEYGIDSRLLRLEITETALLADPGNSSMVISSLRDFGFLVEIDDFGKGYSSLSMLKDIHADVLKIDMSLLCEIENNPRSKAILQTVIALADSLEMGVITEGVEKEAQIRTLSAMGCHCFQGYYFSRPIPAEAFEAFNPSDPFGATSPFRGGTFNAIDRGEFKA